MRHGIAVYLNFSGIGSCLRTKLVTRRNGQSININIQHSTAVSPHGGEYVVCIWKSEMAYRISVVEKSFSFDILSFRYEISEGMNLGSVDTKMQPARHFQLAPLPN